MKIKREIIQCLSRPNVQTSHNCVVVEGSGWHPNENTTFVVYYFLFRFKWKILIPITIKLKVFSGKISWQNTKNVWLRLLVQMCNMSITNCTVKGSISRSCKIYSWSFGKTIRFLIKRRHKHVKMLWERIYELVWGAQACQGHSTLLGEGNDICMKIWRGNFKKLFLDSR